MKCKIELKWPDKFRKFIKFCNHMGVKINVMLQSASVVVKAFMFHLWLMTLLPCLIACRWIQQQTQ